MPLIKDANLALYLAPLNSMMSQYGITTPLREAHFLAQICHESGSLNYSEENLNYSAALLVKVFPHFFPTLDVATPYDRKPDMIANVVYANRLGNGDTASGDGWKYRGRGAIQNTGKLNYHNLILALHVDFVTNPDLLKQPQYSMLAAGEYWKSRGLNDLADKDDILDITKRINGGTNGLNERTANLVRCKQVLGI
jgi:putative chitinase